MSERESPAGALQRLAGELLGATSPAAIGTLVATTAADLLGADAAAVFARADATTLEALHTTGWPDELTRPFRRLELHRGRPLSDAVLDGRPVWLEDAAQWRRRYPDMAAVGTAADMQASACLPLRVEDRDLGAVVFSFAAAARVLRRRARVPGGGHRAVRAGPRPGPPAGRRADGARDGGAPARPDDLPEPHHAPDGGAAVGRGAAAAARRPGRLRDRRLVRRAPRARQPGRPGGGRAQRPGEGRVRRAAAGALPARPGRARRSDAGEPHRRARLLPRDPRRAARRRRRRRRAPRPHPVHRDALRAGRAAGRARAEAGRAHPRAGGVRARASTTPTSRSPSSWRRPRPSRSTTPASTRSSGAPRTPCRPRCCRPTSPRCPGCAWPPATAPPTDADVLVGGDLYDVVPEPDGCGVVVADVCGKGAAAAALTALIRHTVRAEIDHGLGPAAVLERLNRAMLRASGGRPGRFATVAQARLTRTPTGADRAAGQRGPPAAARGPRRPGRAGVRAGHPARHLPGRHLDRGDIRPAPRRDHGALHRWCDGGAGRGRALRARNGWRARSRRAAAPTSVADRAPRRRRRVPARAGSATTSRSS